MKGKSPAAAAVPPTMLMPLMLEVPASLGGMAALKTAAGATRAAVRSDLMAILEA